jgi:hypothetical protein
MPRDRVHAYAGKLRMPDWKTGMVSEPTFSRDVGGNIETCTDISVHSCRKPACQLPKVEGVT